MPRWKEGLCWISYLSYILCYQKVLWPVVRNFLSLDIFGPLFPLFEMLMRSSHGNSQRSGTISLSLDVPQSSRVTELSVSILRPLWSTDLKHSVSWSLISPRVYLLRFLDTSQKGFISCLRPSRVRTLLWWVPTFFLVDFPNRHCYGSWVCPGSYHGHGWSV